MGWSNTRGKFRRMDIWLKLGFDWQDGSGSCSCGLPGKCSRRQLIVLWKEEVCMHDMGRFLRAGQRKACQI